MKILFIGDSITDCVRQRDNPSSLGQGYALMAAGELAYKYPNKNLEFVNKGISGNKVTDLLARWRRDCINIEPDVISIMVGINDLWHEFKRQEGLDIGMYRQVFDILLTETKRRLPHTKVILIEPFVLNVEGEIMEIANRFEPYRQAVKNLATDHNHTHMPLQEIFNEACKTTTATYWAHDGVHPTPAGHMLIAKEWVKVAESIIYK